MIPPADSYNRLLGMLVHHLVSLESMLRFHLYSLEDEPHRPLPDGVVLGSIQPGQILPENAVTDYSQLKRLIERFNARVVPKLQVDVTIVDLRDAIAHGRIFDLPDGSGRFLIKFSKPVDGMCEATVVEELNEGWLRTQNERVLSAIHTVGKATPEDFVTRVIPPRRIDG